MKYFGMILAVLLAGCVGGDSSRRPRTSLFVGIDVSGSFVKSGNYEESLEFLAYYLYAHLRGLGELSSVKALYVGSIGGNVEDETKSFHPIQDFQEKSVEQIVADLKAWYPKANRLTDFNTFFKQVANISQKRNLSLNPITIVLISDGVPDTPGPNGTFVTGQFEKLDLSPLDFLARRVTVRILYPDPPTANKWETAIPRQRVLMWPVDQQVMTGWVSQVDKTKTADQQEKLWKWIADNVDFRVRAIKIRVKSKHG